MDKQEACVGAYRRLKNLKLVGTELGMPWQTVYVHLRRAGEPVTGDKARYGSDTDRLAVRGEAIFKQHVPDAVDMNADAWQSKIDFHVGRLGIDVKTARFLRGSWMFSVKKQEVLADYFVLFAMRDEAVAHTLLIPREIAACYSTIRFNPGGKWAQYEIPVGDLATFFRDAQMENYVQ